MTKPANPDGARERAIEVAAADFLRKWRLWRDWKREVDHRNELPPYLLWAHLLEAENVLDKALEGPTR